MNEDLLRSVSRSFYLSLRFLPSEMRAPVSLAYLMARFSDTVADAASIATAERLAMLDDFAELLARPDGTLKNDPVTWVDSIPHPGERVLLSRSSELLSAYRNLPDDTRALTAEVIHTITTGQRWDLQAFEKTQTACSNAEDLLRYTYQVAGCVGEYWTKIAAVTLGDRFVGPTDSDQMNTLLDQGRKLGQALQLVNILRDLHEDLPNGRCYLPSDELRAAGWSGEGHPSAEVLAPVFNRWLGVCEGFLEESEDYARAVRDLRLRFCTRLPHRLAQHTARLLHSAGAARVMRERIAVPRSTVWRSALWCLFC